MPRKHGFFWLDSMHFLWFGPMADGRYFRFEGVNPDNLRKIWTTQDPGRHEVRLSPIPDIQALATVRLYVEDAKKRRGNGEDERKAA